MSGVDGYVFRKGTFADFDQIVEIIEDGKSSIGKLGIDQWQNGYPPIETIKSDIELGNVYLLVKGDLVAATATVIYDGEITYKEIFEGNWLTSVENYAVVHRMAVRSNFKNQGLACGIMDNVLKMSVLKGVDSVRIDTHRGNVPMQKMIGKCGFIYCGIIYLTDGAERLAYELILKK